jgi:hypothetical protein
MKTIDQIILDYIENELPIEKVGNSYYINGRLANIEEKRAIMRLYRTKEIIRRNSHLIKND